MGATAVHILKGYDNGWRGVVANNYIESWQMYVVTF